MLGNLPAAVATTTATKIAARALFAGTSLVNRNATATNVCSVQSLFGCFTFVITLVLDKTKAFASASVAVLDDGCRSNSSVLSKKLLQLVVTHAEW